MDVGQDNSVTIGKQGSHDVALGTGNGAGDISGSYLVDFVALVSTHRVLGRRVAIFRRLQRQLAFVAEEVEVDRVVHDDRLWEVAADHIALECGDRRPTEDDKVVEAVATCGHSGQILPSAVDLDTGSTEPAHVGLTFGVVEWEVGDFATHLVEQPENPRHP